MPSQRPSAPAAPADRPIAAPEAQRLFQVLEAHRHIALAVSGGSDSTALMWLAAHWSRDRVHEISVLTVDHAYRSNSASEARQVVAWAAELGLKAHILTGTGERPVSGLQAKARQLRYRVLSDWCLEAQASVLVTAHTQDDQAETFLMRLARGSGIAGLGGIAAHARGADGLVIARPLLDVPRSRLRATLLEAGHDWIEDPSNEDTHFERVRLRKAMPLLAGLGVTPQALARSAGRLARAAQPLSALVSELMCRTVAVQAQGHAVIERAPFMAAAPEIRIMALQRILEMMGGAASPPRLMAVERLDAWLAGEESDARTLSGCRIARRSRTLIIGREPGRIDLRPLSLSSAGVIWDRRFAVNWSGAPEGAVILPQGRGAGLASAPDLPAFVQASLPAIFLDGRLIAAPFGGHRPEGLTFRFLHLPPALPI